MSTSYDTWVLLSSSRRLQEQADREIERLEARVLELARQLARDVAPRRQLAADICPYAGLFDYAAGEIVGR